MRCRQCSRLFRIDEGIVRFVEDDGFYEGTYQGQIHFVPKGGPASNVLLYLVNNHYLWWVRKYVEPGARLLELGSGGGVRFFAQYARATAVDLSFSSLLKLDPGYELALQADALNLPLADGSYDAVACAYFYEHIPLADKPRLLAELRRVLRSGGRIVLLFDAASQNPLFRWYRRDAEQFQRCFVDHDHHYGLETATANIRRFEDAGFAVLDVHCANKTPLQNLSVYEWSRPYGHWLTDGLARAADALAKRPALGRAYTVGLTLMDDVLEPLLPMDWARIMLAVLERK